MEKGSPESIREGNEANFVRIGRSLRCPEVDPFARWTQGAQGLEGLLEAIWYSSSNGTVLPWWNLPPPYGQVSGY